MRKYLVVITTLVISSTTYSQIDTSTNDLMSKFSNVLQQKTVQPASILPKKNDPIAESTFKIMSETSYQDMIDSSSNFPNSETDHFCQSINEIGTSYLMHGVMDTMNKKLDTSDAQTHLLKITASNNQEFQNEFSIIQPLLIECTAIELVNTSNFVSKNFTPSSIDEIRTKGIRQMQSGSFGMLASAITVTNDENMNIINRRILLETTAEFSNVLSGALKPNTRRLLWAIAQINLNKTKDKELGVALGKITDSLYNEECKNLCKY